jgi:hypothetical protein
MQIGYLPLALTTGATEDIATFHSSLAGAIAMSQTADWLQRLDGTTNYADLQEIFAQLAAQTESSREDPQVAAKIDDVIQRLIGERVRDERELNEVQSRYESFKEDNRGVIGWFKRHLPFTATRRQELDHQGELADQTAEILADNLVIARAQMLKERLLPRERRRLGQRINDWESLWERDRRQPSSAARLLVQLNGELEQSRAFVEELKRDINAFAGAKFKEAADRERRDADLAVAGHELESLNQEIAAELTLKQSGLKLLVAHVASELEVTDSEFRHDGQQLEKVAAALTRLNESRASFAKLVATVGQIGTLAKQLQSWPEQLQQARQAAGRIEAERAAAAQVSAAKSQVVQERQLRLGDAQRIADQAKQTLSSLQPAYDAYLAQRAASSSMPLAVEAEPLAPIAQQYQTARSGVDQAQANLREITAALDAARQEVTQAEANVKAVTDKLAAEQQKLKDFEKKEPQMRSELARHVDLGHPEFAVAASMLAGYLQIDRLALRLSPFQPGEVAAGTFGYLGPRGMEPGFANALFNSGHDFARHVQAATTLERLGQWQQSQHQMLEQERIQMRSRRESIWKGRCSELLGDRLAAEACAGGLP